MGYSVWSKRLIILITAADHPRARQAAVTVWGEGQEGNLDTPYNGGYVCNATLTEDETALWRAELVAFTDHRYYLLDAASDTVLESNSPYGVVGQVYRWPDVQVDIKRTVWEVTPANIAALLVSTEVQAGDILKMDGDYEGDYECSLRGSAAHPVVIDASAARINGTFHALSTGQHVTLMVGDIGWDGWTSRVSTYDGVLYPPPDVEHPQSQSGGVQVHMPHFTLRHSDVHDERTNIGTWKEAEGGRLEYVHSYHAGWYSTKPGDHAHGEGWYPNGETGERVAEGCIFHDNGDHAVVPYSTNAPLKNIHVRRCTLYNDELQFGGQQPMTNVGMSESLTYATNDIIIGFGNVAHESAYLRDNVLCMAPNQAYGIWTARIDHLECTGNIIIGNETTHMVRIEKPPADWSQWKWDNQYWWVERLERMGTPFYINGKDTDGNFIGEIDFDRWRAITGFDKPDAFHYGLPDDIINVRVSPYKPVAHVTVYNFSQRSTQPVDLGALPYGRYRAVSTMNRAQGFGFEWAGEAVSFSMVNWTNTAPIAWPNGTPIEKTTAPQFMCWVIKALP